MNYSNDINNLTSLSLSTDVETTFRTGQSEFIRSVKSYEPKKMCVIN